MGNDEVDNAEPSNAPTRQLTHASAEDRFGKNVRNFRVLRRLTQAELAQRMGELGVHLHPSAIAKIETRDSERPRAIRLDEAEAIARALGVGLHVLLGPVPNDWEEAAGEVATTMHGMFAQRPGLAGLAEHLRKVTDDGSDDAQAIRAAVNLDLLAEVLDSMPWDAMERYVQGLMQQPWWQKRWPTGATR